MRNYNVLISKEWKFFVAKNLDLGVVSQWWTIEESLTNIREATELFTENDNKIKFESNNTFLTTISV